MVQLCETFRELYKVWLIWIWGDSAQNGRFHLENQLNGLCIKYQDAVPEVKMHLLNAYCCHFYGSQTWSFNDKNIKYILTAWNKAVRKIWNLPYDSHKTLIYALNNGYNALDFIYMEFSKMYNCMANNENTKLSMFIKMSKNDKRMILFRNLRCVCKNWCVSESKW